MNNYGFHFAESYQGYWNIAQIGRKIPGTLHIEKHSIRLELFWNNVTHVDLRVIPSATGYAYTDIENKKTCYYFVLKGLQLMSVSWFGKHQSQYKLDVNNFCMSDKPRFSTNGIVNCCIRTQLMDKWVWDYTQESYSDLWPYKENESIEVKYQAKPSLTLFESVLFELYLRFGYEAYTPNADGFGMSTHTFLNLRLKKKQKFYDALDFAESVIWLFSLLWNNQFSPDFIEFRTSKGKFIYKKSDKYQFKYFDVINKSLRTDISDFDVKELSYSIESWFRFVEKEKVSIGSFFETQYNEHIIPSAKIKNYMSVVDGLIKNEKTEKVEVEHGCADLLDKISRYINKKERKMLNRLMFRNEKFTLKEKLEKVIDGLHSYIELNIEDDFSSKAVNTRNVLTHVCKKTEKIYKKDQYMDLAFCLELLIMAFLLQQIGVHSEISKKIIGVISSPE